MGDSKNYFSLTGTKEGFGSAKKLSLERAEVIRDYLVNEGIDSKRIEIKAWGGKQPIFDKLSTRAQENVRVEVEILED
jgi:outer membrane protein OmpA-like peptidoglycan-associated protein